MLVQPDPPNEVKKPDQEMIHLPFPVWVEGVDVCGEEFKVETALDNRPRGRLYLRMAYCVAIGANLSIVFRGSRAIAKDEKSPRVCVRGVVLRTEPQVGGVCGVVVRLISARFV